MYLLLALLIRVTSHAESCTPNGIRTRAATLKGWCPRPLDDGGSDENSVERALEIYQRWFWFHPGESSVTGNMPAWAVTIQSSSQPK